MIVAKIDRSEQPRISVWLSEKEDKILKKFHCSVCGKIVFEYYSPIRMIIPGKHIKKTPKVVRCNGMMTIDKLTNQVVHPDSRRFHEQRHRFYVTRCMTKYWIS